MMYTLYKVGRGVAKTNAVVGGVVSLNFTLFDNSSAINASY